MPVPSLTYLRKVQKNVNNDVITCTTENVEKACQEEHSLCVESGDYYEDENHQKIALGEVTYDVAWSRRSNKGFFNANAGFGCGIGKNIQF